MNKPSIFKHFISIGTGTVINMLVGVYSAGYSFREELPILALVFAVPAAAALLVRALLERRS